ncbi:MAG: 3-oxoisoapionate-4-phosphate transcarboxylase/hydrolase [Solirubrobacteraceae bacterium]
MSGDVVRATYLLESHLPLERAAAVVAGEQSSGTFVRVAGETDELRARFGARVVSVERVDSPPGGPLPGAVDGGTLRCGRVTIDFPLANFGPSIPNLLAAVTGNLFELRELAGVKLLDLDLPDAFAAAYPGPQFGPRGTRELMGAGDGVLIGSIVKPSVGLTPEQTAALVSDLADGGADFVKDDELTANPPHAPLRERVRAVMATVEDAAQRRGRKLMFAFNITDDISLLREHHDLVREAGGTCVMVCVNAVGLAGVAYLREHSQLPIHVHRAGLGALTRGPRLGIAFRAIQKLVRLAGGDHFHANGMANKFYETDDEALAAIAALREPLLGGYDCLPVLSSAQWAGTAPVTYERVGSTELLVLAGGGIHAHPGGTAAGVASIRQGWEAAIAGVPLSEYARDHRALRQAIERFGER